jgi:helix-turn-helix protein
LRRSEKHSWLRHWLADNRLTPADKILCALIFLYFNQRRHERTTELQAWPSWKTITAETGLSERSIHRGLDKLERLGALEIIRRRNPRTGQRLQNEYLAPPAKLAGGRNRLLRKFRSQVPKITKQSRLLHHNGTTCQIASRLLEDRLGEELRGKQAKKRGLPREPSALKKEKPGKIEKLAEPSKELSAQIEKWIAERRRP